MQISKSFLVVCAAALCAALLPLRAAEPDLQNKLQEALDKKLNELQSQPPAAVPTPKPAVATPKPKKKKPAPAPAPAPAAQPAPASIGGRPTPPAQWTPPPVAKPSPVAQPAAPAPAVQPVPAPTVQPAPVPAPAAAVQAPSTPVLGMPPAADPEVIAKAREALRQKMSELEAKPASQPAPAAKPAPAAAPPVVTPAPPAQPPPAVAQPVPAPTPPPVAQPLPAVAQPAPAPAPVPPPAAQPAPAVAQPAPAPAVQATPQPALVAPTPVDEATIAKAREALRQKMQQLEAQPPASTVAKPGEAQPQVTAIKPGAKPTAEKAPKKPASMKGALAFPPIQGPPPSISADKQQRLAELLRKYKAEEITPEEYHQQRAKIMSEP